MILTSELRRSSSCQCSFSYNRRTRSRFLINYVTTGRGVLKKKRLHLHVAVESSNDGVNELVRKEVVDKRRGGRGLFAEQKPNISAGGGLRWVREGFSPKVST